MLKVLGITMVDMGKLPMSLPVPNSVNTGGYIVPPCVYAYSPVDIAVAGLEAYRLGETVTDLAPYFNKDFMLSELLVTLIIDVSGSAELRSVTEWKHLSKTNKELLKVLKTNAPLTFKRHHLEAKCMK